MPQNPSEWVQNIRRASPPGEVAGVIFGGAVGVGTLIHHH